MKDYELSILFHPDLEMNLDPALDKVKNLIEANGGEITKEVAEGKKHLSYPIKNQEYAVYYYYDAKLPAEAPNKLKNVMDITDEILRVLIVKADERKAKYAARRKERDPEAAEESADGDTEEATVKVTEEVEA